jgi:FlaA1/EpsC-like NDP-sugar epimerase
MASSSAPLHIIESGPEIKYDIQSSSIQGEISGQTILIIGGTGSLGMELIKFYGKRNRLIVFSRDECKQYMLRLKFPGLSFIVGDIRSIESVSRALKMYKPDIIIVAAALKQIDTCEINVSEAVLTNVMGAHNVVEAVFAVQPPNLKKVLYVSTDKACLPISAYGATKYLAEKIMVEAGYRGHQAKLPIQFLAVRYGNVMNSRGSLLPKFQEIGEDPTATEFPVTDVRMSRFFMLLSHASRLIDVALTQGHSGEIWIPKIQSYRIQDVADYYAKLYSKTTKIIGLRMCEKLHESLVSQDEVESTEARTYGGETFYVVNPFYSARVLMYGKCHDLTAPYTSEQVSSIEEFVAMLARLREEKVTALKVG